MVLLSFIEACSFCLAEFHLGVCVSWSCFIEVCGGEFVVVVVVEFCFGVMFFC